MRREFSFSDARNLIRLHKNLKYNLVSLNNKQDEARALLEHVAQKYISNQAIRMAKNVSIVEVNREKKGIRVSILKNAGFNNFADVFKASVYELSAIRGISENGAIEIKRIVYETVEELKKRVKLKLSLSNKSKDVEDIIRFAFLYMYTSQFTKVSNNLADKYFPVIESAVEQAKPAKGFLRWAFASNENRQSAIEACKLLSDILAGEYGQQANHSLENLDKIRNFSCDPWDELQKNPIQCANVIEDLVPGLLGSVDDFYGLPEGLAGEVKKQPILSDGLSCQLRRYQQLGVKYILHQKRVLLGDEMGLGKTVQAIAAMVSLRNEGGTHFIVICPASIIVNWCKEIKRFSNLRVVKVHGSQRDREFALQDWMSNGGVAVTTYEMTSYFNLPDNFEFSMIAVDEAHYIKNPETKRYQNTKLILNHANNILFMTGTALENKVSEMVKLIKLLQPDIAAEIAGTRSFVLSDLFKEKIAPVYYRRKREDVLFELPELIENKSWCQLNAEEESEYEKALMSGNFHAIRRVSWNVDDMRNSSKAKLLKEIVEEAELEERKVLIFSFYLDTLHKVVDVFSNKCIGLINGSVSPERRIKIIEEFDNAPAGSVLVSQIMSGGTGLNIQSASVVVICEPQLKPSTENQAISRAYRMGQSMDVIVYHLLAEKTIDEGITKVLENKQEIFNRFADESVAAQKVEIDEKTLGKLVDDEVNRISKNKDNVKNVSEEIESKVENNTKNELV